MKTIRNIAALALLTLSLAACGGSNSSETKSIGGSSDTGRSPSDQGVTSVGGVDSTLSPAKTDSATKNTTGNANPTGHQQ